MRAKTCLKLELAFWCVFLLSMPFVLAYFSVEEPPDTQSDRYIHHRNKDEKPLSIHREDVKAILSELGVGH